MTRRSNELTHKTKKNKQKNKQKKKQKKKKNKKKTAKVLSFPGPD